MMFLKKIKEQNNYFLLGIVFLILFVSYHLFFKDKREVLECFESDNEKNRLERALRESFKDLLDEFDVTKKMYVVIEKKDNSDAPEILTVYKSIDSKGIRMFSIPSKSMYEYDFKTSIYDGSERLKIYRKTLNTKYSLYDSYDGHKEIDSRMSYCNKIPIRDFLSKRDSRLRGNQI